MNQPTKENTMPTYQLPTTPLWLAKYRTASTDAEIAEAAELRDDEALADLEATELADLEAEHRYAKKHTNVLVTGDRNYANAAAIRARFEKIDDEHQEVTLFEGGALGADRLARIEAERLGWEVKTFHAEWTKYKKAAGSKRNDAMLAAFLKAGVGPVYAFKHKLRTDGGGGTEHMIRALKAKQIPGLHVT